MFNTMTPGVKVRLRRGLVRTLACGILAAGLGGCLDLSQHSQADNARQGELSATADADELKRYLTHRFTQVQPVSIYDGGDPTTEAMVDAADDSAPSSASEPFSTSNNQVAGVDEGDIWKYDGTHFFVLQKTPSAQLRVVNNQQATLARLDLNHMHPHEMYLSEDAVVVLGNQGWQGGQADIQVFNISDASTPTPRLDIKVDGYVLRSRRIGHELIIVSRYTPELEGIIHYPSNQQQIEHNQHVISELSLAALLPNIRINDRQQPLVRADDCLLATTPAPSRGSPTLSMITRIDINSGEFSSRCIAAEVEGIYMSEHNLYLFSGHYGEISEPTQANVTGWYSNQGNTLLHKFALPTFNYQGSTTVPGRLGSPNPRLKMGELHDGSLAVVTSEGQWGDEHHRLTVLGNQDDEFSQLATLPNDDQPAAIGKPGERIYSVRFMQDRAYIVTFQEVDPLYVIDLSKPSEPVIAGELEIPGFSDYLHPIGDDLLLGIGKDAIMGDSGTTWFQGVKVSLFNVADIHNPSALGSIIIGKRGSNTALSHEPHAFSGIQQDGQYRFAFPISVHDGDAGGTYWRDPESQYYNWTQSGLYMFEIEDNQLSQRGAMITERHDGTQRWQNWNQRRGLIQGDDVYHLSGGDLYHADWNDPQQLSDKF